MKTKRKTPAGVKLIACLLLLGSLLMLVPLRALPWMKLVVDDPANLDRMSLEEVLGWFGQDRERLPETLSLLLNQSGTQADAGQVRELTDVLLDAYYTLPDLARLADKGGAVLNTAGMREYGQMLGFASLGVWILLGLLALLGLVALICLLTEHRGGMLPYFLLGALTLTGLILARRAGNDWLEQSAMQALKEQNLDFLPKLLSIDLRIIHMGIAAYLCPFLALLSFLLMLIRKRRTEPEEEPATPYPGRRRTPEAPWTCPQCGGICRDGGSFCTVCGSPKPMTREPGLCPDCGAPLDGNAPFCPYCGKKLR